MEPSQAISAGPGAAPAPVRPPLLPGTRPWASAVAASLPVTALIGRQRECEGAAAALDSSRLVTLMGPGGVGKTRRLAHHRRRLAALPGPDTERGAG